MYYKDERILGIRLACFLGIFGIHDFYLRKIPRAVAKLVLTLLAALFFGIAFGADLGENAAIVFPILLAFGALFIFISILGVVVDIIDLSLDKYEQGSKAGAILYSIFLGPLGIHDLYLKQPKRFAGKLFLMLFSAIPFLFYEHANVMILLMGLAAIGELIVTLINFIDFFAICMNKYGRFAKWKLIVYNIFGGIFGLHNFYLVQPGKGLTKIGIYVLGLSLYTIFTNITMENSLYIAIGCLGVCVFIIFVLNVLDFSVNCVDPDSTKADHVLESYWRYFNRAFTSGSSTRHVPAQPRNERTEQTHETKPTFEPEEPKKSEPEIKPEEKKPEEVKPVVVPVEHEEKKPETHYQRPVYTVHHKRPRRTGFTGFVIPPKLLDIFQNVIVNIVLFSLSIIILILLIIFFTLIPTTYLGGIHVFSIILVIIDSLIVAYSVIALYFSIKDVILSKLVKFCQWGTVTISVISLIVGVLLVAPRGNYLEQTHLPLEQQVLNREFKYIDNESKIALYYTFEDSRYEFRTEYFANNPPMSEKIFGNYEILYDEIYVAKGNHYQRSGYYIFLDETNIINIYSDFNDNLAYIALGGYVFYPTN